LPLMAVLRSMPIAANSSATFCVDDSMSEGVTVGLEALRVHKERAQQQQRQSTTESTRPLYDCTTYIFLFFSCTTVLSAGANSGWHAACPVTSWHDGSDSCCFSCLCCS
jgi:hypothetical protein